MRLIAYDSFSWVWEVEKESPLAVGDKWWRYQRQLRRTFIWQWIWCRAREIGHWDLANLQNPSEKSRGTNFKWGLSRSKWDIWRPKHERGRFKQRNYRVSRKQSIFKLPSKPERIHWVGRFIRWWGLLDEVPIAVHNQVWRRFSSYLECSDGS